MKQEWWETKNQALDRLRKLLRGKQIKRLKRQAVLMDIFKKQPFSLA